MKGDTLVTIYISGTYGAVRLTSTPIENRSSRSVYDVPHFTKLALRTSTVTRRSLGVGPLSPKDHSVILQVVL